MYKFDDNRLKRLWGCVGHTLSLYSKLQTNRLSPFSQSVWCNVTWVCMVMWWQLSTLLSPNLDGYMLVYTKCYMGQMRVKFLLDHVLLLLKNWLLITCDGSETNSVLYYAVSTYTLLMDILQEEFRLFPIQFWKKNQHKIRRQPFLKLMFE